MQKIVLKQWNDFLERCQIDQAKMPANQHREMKRAFFGAAGQLLIYMRDDLGAESEEKAAAIFQEMLDEVGVFWQIEVVTHDAEMAANPKPSKPAPPAGEYIPYSGDWLGLLKQIIPYLQDLDRDNIHDPGVGLRRDENLTKVLQDANLMVAAGDALKKLEGDRPKSFASELTTLVNRYSKENGSNTPDYVLANFLQNSLAAFDLAVNQREGHPEPDLVTRIKNKLRDAGNEVMRDIEGKTLAAFKVPELTVGLKYGSIHQPGQLYEIMYIDRNTDKCNVEITLQERKWQDNGICIEYMRGRFQAGEYFEIKANKTYGAALGNNAPEIKVGLKFMNMHMPGQLMEVIRVYPESNLIDVKIGEVSGASIAWVDKGWNMEHTRWGFERGEYWEVDGDVDMFALYLNNSDAFRHWAEKVKGCKIGLLEHQTGVKLPDGVTRMDFWADWLEYEKANNPKFKPGGMMSGSGRPGGDDREVADAVVDRHLGKMKNRECKESPHTLDEKGFFFYLKTGGIGWCRMYGGVPWFMAQTDDGQWYTGKQVNQTEIWNAKTSEVTPDEDAALRKTIPNE